MPSSKPWLTWDCRWDKRGSGSGPTKPTADIVAHDAEVNSVAFSPWDENILLTGSSDKVRHSAAFVHAVANIVRENRASGFGIFGTRARNYILSFITKTKYYNSPSPLTLLQSLHLAHQTAESTFGTWPVSV